MPGLPYPTSDPIGEALWWYNPPEDSGGTPGLTRPALPPLGPGATARDQALYEQIQQLYNGTYPGDANNSPGEAFLNQLEFGPDSPGTDFIGHGYRDPAILNFLAAENYAANYDIPFSFFGDPFFTMGGLAISGAVGGGLAGAGAAAGAGAGAAGEVSTGAVGGGVAAGETGGAALGGVGGAVEGAGAGGALVGGGGTGTLLGGTGGEVGGDVLVGEGAVDGFGGVAAGAGGDTLSYGGAVAGGAGATGGLLSSLKDYAPLIGPAVSAIGSVAGGIINSGAARDAATTQANAAREANRILLDMYGQNRADAEPYRTAGYSALNALGQLNMDPLTYPGYTPTPVYHGPSDADLRADPGYQFRVSEGQKALERSAAGKGLLLSGGQLKDLTRFGQQQGAQEYGEAYARGYAQNADLNNRNLQAYQTNFGTLAGLRTQRYNELSNVAGLGQLATNQTAQLGAQTGARVGEGTIGAGNALAAGRVGSANAVSAGLSGVGGAANQYNNYLLLSSLLNRQPAAA